MIYLQSFHPRIPLPIVEGENTSTWSVFTVGKHGVTSITQDGPIVRVEREGKPAMRIVTEGHGVEVEHHRELLDALSAQGRRATATPEQIERQVDTQAATRALQQSQANAQKADRNKRK